MKKNLLAFTFGAVLMANHMKAQVTPVDPSTFNGLYYTESKMKIKYGGDFPFKTDEVTLSFDASTGLLSGKLEKANSGMDALKLHGSDYVGWAKKSGIWVWRNDNNNKNNYGPLFDYNNVTMATFIEEGVLVFVDASYWPDEKKFKAKLDQKLVTILAKDKSKLSMDKITAAKKAEEMMTAAGAEVITKSIQKQVEEGLMVPNETLSKTDKELKKEVTNLLKGFMNPDDTDAEFVCAYTSTNDWNIIKNKNTGVILSREINAEMILKNKKSGKCWRNPYTLTAQYNGSGFGKLAFGKKWNMIQCDCTQTDKNK